MFNPLEFLLERLVLLRNRLYLGGHLSRCGFESTAVVSVGNLSVGGTGKTPAVLELARYLTSKGFRVSILLRGYGRETRGTLLVSDGREVRLSVREAGDEAFLYAKLLRGVAVVVSEDRCRGAELLVREFNPDFILLDDALQHLKIRRDLDVVLLTPRDLKDRLFPFGRLREPPSVLRLKGDYCLFSKTEGANLQLENFCSSLGKEFGYLSVKGYRLLDPRLREVDFETIKGREVGVVAAVGDNDSFFKAVKELGKRYGFKPVRFLGFRDHYHYRDTRLDDGLLWITTLKDFFKLREKNENLAALDRLIELPESLLRRVEKLRRSSPVKEP